MLIIIGQKHETVLLLLISRPTPRLLSFALCREWINGIYNTLDTDCLECYTPHTARFSGHDHAGNRSQAHQLYLVETRQKYAHDICRENGK